MPVNNTQVEVTDQAGGQRHVVLRMFTDGANPTVITVPFTAGPTADIDAMVAQQVAQLNEQLADDEYRALIGEVPQE